ncbi:MAG: YHS domain-containing protein [PVC group bacterium]|nr:YHS domain-containing protein [PVC group bacterium]
MKIFFIAVLVMALLIGGAMGPISYAQCGGGKSMCVSEGGMAKGPINDECPVMEGKVKQDTQYTAEYNGKIVGFCCADCVKTFNTNPEKYYNSIPQVEK